MPITISRSGHFYAAHRNENLPESKCSRLHGHRYDVIVDFEMEEVDSTTGVTVLFEDLGRILDPILNLLDHRTLMSDRDDVLGLLPKDWIVTFPFPTSAENLAFMLNALLDRQVSYCALPGISIRGVCVSETNSSEVYLDHESYLESNQHLLVGKNLDACIDDFFERMRRAPKANRPA